MVFIIAVVVIAVVIVPLLVVVEFQRIVEVFSVGDTFAVDLWDVVLRSAQGLRRD